MDSIEEIAYGTCEYWKRMDKIYNTDKNSPLHHDNRCKYVDHAIEGQKYAVLKRA